MNLQHNPVVRVVLALLLIASVNLIVTRAFFRVDLTENKELTLSKSTKNILGGLDDLVNVTVYFSKSLPSYLATLDRQVKDLMDEYKSASGGNLNVTFVDPDEDPALEQSVQMMGIPKLQLSQYQKERAEVVTAFMGIAVQYEDKNEVIPVVQTVDRLEYDLTSAILKVSTERKTVGLAATGAAIPEQDLRGVQEILQRQYNVRPVDPNVEDVPMEVSTLVVIDDDAWGEEALYRIDQFVMRGGRLLALANGVSVDLGTLQARPRQVAMGDMLRSYGAEILSTLVVDGQCPLVSFDMGFIIPLSVRYPWFVQAIEGGLSAENPITSDLQNLVLPWTSPLRESPIDSSAGASVHFEVLARSSEQSFAKGAPFDLNPRSQITPPAEGLEPQILAAAISGRVPSHWRAGAPVPGDTLGTAAKGPEVSQESQIVVVGSWNFAQDRFLGQYQTGALFVANAVDWMTLGNDLIEIRSRGAVTRPLREVEDNKKTLLKTLAMVPVPVLVVLFGLVRTRLRRQRRERYATEFGGGAS